MESDKFTQLKNKLKKDDDIKRLKEENSKLSNEASFNKVIIVLLIVGVFGPVILKHC